MRPSRTCGPIRWPSRRSWRLTGRSDGNRKRDPMPTNLQLKLIHIAYRQANLEEAQYRTILRNVAGVESAKDLDQAGFEDVMAVIEDCGFREKQKPGDYWRNKVRARGGAAGERMVH